MPAIVAVGANALAIRSEDANRWSIEATPISSLLNGVRFGQGQYVAAGAGGAIITSPDGSAPWTSQTSGTTQALFRAIFANNLWVLVGNNIVLRSADAVTWANVAGPFAVDQHDVARDGSNFVLVAAGGSVATSSDAITWNAETSGVVADLHAIEFAAFLSLFIAVGDGGVLITSPDGVTWTPGISGTSSDLRALIVDEDNGRLVIAGENGSILTSTDGVNWSGVASPSTDQWEDGFYKNGLYMLAGATAPSAVQRLGVSLNAEDWALESGAGTDELLGIDGDFPKGLFDTIAGFGEDSWGIGLWGSAVPLSPLSVTGAVALSTKEVQVTVSREAQVLASTVAGDALNPATWVIQRLDTAFLFSVLSVRQVDPLTFIVSVLQDFGSQRVTHRILTTTLLDSDGNPVTLNQADYAGLLSAEAKDEASRARRSSNAVRDVANPPVPNSPAGGTLIINSGGDYELEDGAALLKKLIIRRLTTQKGGFFHLPEYGVGLAVKGLLPAANLIKLRADIIRQVKREPEVTAADVQLSLGTQNDLTVRVRAQIDTGGSLDFSFPVQSGQVVL